MKKQHDNSSGRSMLEIVAVLAIASSLTLGGVYLYETVATKVDASSLVEEISTIATKNRMELLHSEQVSPKEVKTAKGAIVTTKTSDDNSYSFLVEVASINENLCQELARTGLLTEENSSLAKIDSDECPGKIVFYFKKDFSDDDGIMDTQKIAEVLSDKNEGGYSKTKEVSEGTKEQDDKGRSILCEKNYYLYDNECEPCPEHCACDGKVILGAETGYYQKGHSCFPCGDNVKRCTEDEKPLACVDDYYLDGEKCTKCPANSTTTEYSHQKIEGTSCYCRFGFRVNSAKNGCEEGCDDSVDCPSDKPVCHGDKKCGACEANNASGTQNSCPTEMYPLCQGGKCISCSGKTVWNAIQKKCKECSETDLSYCPTNKPYCNVNEGNCVACLEHNHCLEGQFCNTKNACEGCAVNQICPSCPSDRPLWNGKQCVVCTSQNTSLCSSKYPYCDVNEGSCIQCYANHGANVGACKDEQKPLCDVGTHTCHACPDATPFWNGKECVACLEDAHCSLGKMCTETGLCEDCAVHSFCGSCAEANSNKTYWDGKKCAGCTSQNTNSCSPEYPYCDVNEGSCIQCYANHGANEGACKDKQKPLCDVNTHTCHACPDATPFWNGQECVAGEQCLGAVTECGTDALGFMYKGHLYCYNTHEEFVNRCREAVPHTTSCHNGQCFYASNSFNEDFPGNCHWGYFDIQDINNWCASKNGSRISQNEMIEIWDAFMACDPSFGKHNEACYWTNTNACRMKNGNWNNARPDGYINAGGGICKIY